MSDPGLKKALDGPEHSGGPANAPDKYNRLAKVMHLISHLMKPSLLPVGETLSSLYLGGGAPPVESESENLIRQEATKVVHDAFWDETLKMLSDTNISHVIDRLKMLYTDTQRLCISILPNTNPHLRTFSQSVPPSPNPLTSAVNDIHGLLLELRTRCAPIRDQLIEDADAELMDSALDQPHTVSRAFCALFNILELMKTDSRQFTSRNIGEDRMRRILLTQARLQEHRVLHEIFSLDTLIEQDRLWLHPSAPQPDDYAERLLSLVLAGATSPTYIVIAGLPMDNDNEEDKEEHVLFPPHFVMMAPLMRHIQDMLQAIVMAASLCVQFPQLRKAPTSNGEESLANVSTLARIWTLLQEQVEAPLDPVLHIVNIEDEVVQSLRRAGTPQTAETNTRKSVRNLLRTDNAVFTLLMKRLIPIFREYLKGLIPLDGPQLSDPEISQTRGDILNAKPLVSHETERQERLRSAIKIAGFPDNVLFEPLADVASDIQRIIQWMWFSWLPRLSPLEGSSEHPPNTTLPSQTS